MQEQTYSFQSSGLSCRGRLFTPDNPAIPSPIVIMGHGYGAEWCFGTASFIEGFVAAGFAVLAFDYRYFGESDGQPRQLIDPAQRLDDWRAAISSIRSVDSIDAAKIVLWGSSFGGGHALSIAAEDYQIAGVIAQVPHVDAREVAKHTPTRKGLAALGHALLDSVLSLFGKQHRVAIVGKPGEGFAVLDYPGWYQDYLSLGAGSSTWDNSIPARSLLRGSQYSPIDTAEQIRCPVLIVNGANDQGVPAAAVKATVDKITHCKQLEYPIDHFDCYAGWELHNEILAQQCRFLNTLF